MTVIPKIETAAQEVLSHHEDVMAAYLLGSALNGGMRSDSDIDLALLIGSGDDLEWNMRIEIANDLELLLGRTVDLGGLTTGNLVYARQAILRGRCVYSRCDSLRDEFAVRALGLYEDLRINRMEVDYAYSQ